MKKRKIYTERIHYVGCVICKEDSNTFDCDHQMAKSEAVCIFELEGWRYIKFKGWHCPECSMHKNGTSREIRNET